MVFAGLTGETGSFDASGKADDIDGKAGEESDTFSDIDDIEVPQLFFYSTF